MTGTQIFITILMAVIGSVVTRFLPFVLFPEGRKVPDYVRYLGRVLGASVFGILVVYCFRNTDVTTSFALGGTHGIPELIGLIVTAGTFCWKRKMVISMAAGTAVYMILVQTIF
ncbi:MAG: branched-chain amino acid transporter permease [Eubacterium sp.]|jgi:branched-subunit amino acid transport protein AzlD